MEAEREREKENIKEEGRKKGKKEKKKKGVMLCFRLLEEFKKIQLIFYSWNLKRILGLSNIIGLSLLWSKLLCLLKIHVEIVTAKGNSI